MMVDDRCPLYRSASLLALMSIHHSLAEFSPTHIWGHLPVQACVLHMHISAGPQTKVRIDSTQSGLGGSLTAEEEQAMLAQYHYTGATTAIHPLLSSMVNYAQAVKFQGFDVAEGQPLPSPARCVPHVLIPSSLSLSETVALGLMKNEAIEFVKYPF
ncbi:unnamed protein product [Dibothriocephalus latus]|uniref:PI-PLC Y-box domain-containing protein n=1 Tax=Dibothriocephalus latus TaxID=60516 RepID=A0A3P7LUH2_DIBLA|nr:unnamed protein product [Dibothriocephalus latus]